MGSAITRPLRRGTAPSNPPRPIRRRNVQAGEKSQCTYATTAAHSLRASTASLASRLVRLAGSYAASCGPDDVLVFALRCFLWLHTLRTQRVRHSSRSLRIPDEPRAAQSMRARRKRGSAAAHQEQWMARRVCGLRTGRGRLRSRGTVALWRVRRVAVAGRPDLDDPWGTSGTQVVPLVALSPTLRRRRRAAAAGRLEGALVGRHGDHHSAQRRPHLPHRTRAPQHRGPARYAINSCVRRLGAPGGHCGPLGARAARTRRGTRRRREDTQWYGAGAASQLVQIHSISSGDGTPSRPRRRHRTDEFEGEKRPCAWRPRAMQPSTYGYFLRAAPLWIARRLQE